MAPYYPHLPRSLKTSVRRGPLNPGIYIVWSDGGLASAHTRKHTYTHTHTHIHIRICPIVHIGNENIALCTSPPARHSLYVTAAVALSTPHMPPPTRHPLHVNLCTSFSANCPLHVTLCTSPPTCHSLYVTPYTSLPVCRPLTVTLCTSLYY